MFKFLHYFYKIDYFSFCSMFIILICLLLKFFNLSLPPQGKIIFSIFLSHIIDFCILSLGIFMFLRGSTQKSDKETSLHCHIIGEFLRQEDKYNTCPAVG